ncbi:MAG: hypothetical protein M0Z77_04215 [Thermoplasmatales archaeon]|nr:hypothetical protein [Thermoplasmatales archaeon]
MCPLAADTSQIWYSEDGVCRNPEFEAITRSMKKLKRKGAQGYFTLEMLNRDFTIRSGIVGVDPDVPDTIKNPERWYQLRERKWILVHPEKKQLPEQEIEKRRLRMKTIRKVPSSIHYSEIVDSKGVIARPDPQSFLKPIENGGFGK